MTGGTFEESLGFDRAAGYYDSTRRREPETVHAVTALLAAELKDRGHCLEVGVGTGRLALPLAAAGVDMAGVDVSEQMLTKLIANAGGRPPFPLARADATELPFPTAWFGAALVSHVLQLVPRWRTAVAELVRVVRPDGLVIVDLGWRRGVRLELQQRFAEEAGLDRIDIGLDPTNAANLDHEFRRHGAYLRELTPIVERRDATLRELVARLEQGVVPVTWSVDADTRRQASAAVGVWAQERYGPLDRPYSLETIIAMRAYDLR